MFQNFMNRLVFAWLITVAVLWATTLLVRTLGAASADWAVSALFICGIPYVLLMGRWVIRG